MTNSNDIEAIFERLATRTLTEADVQLLRDTIINQNVAQTGNKYAVNIGNVTGYIHIGDSITYEGTDTTIIREILQKLENIQRQPPQVSNQEILRYLQGRYPPRDPGIGRIYLLIIVPATWLIVSLIISGLLYKYPPNSTTIILQSFSVLLGSGLQLYYIGIACLRMLNYKLRARLGFLLVAPLIVWVLIIVYCSVLESILISAKIIAGVNFIELTVILFVSYGVLACLGTWLGGRVHGSSTVMIDRWLFWSFSPFITIFHLHRCLFQFVGQIFGWGR
ncbi:hypothetical protein [Limnofasciculus baicalensis]|uniref:Effector-associated domain-containing protein n=1 Tax=Limnofasciculus baicalensis BBK-W-15 TaxID=2699891 RepID=A0AAE3KS18_9CYAN|nr:hypothetical protein [Limnofasciculus baicalensis]MCP2729032.1 hypothetical protein [Limnofasciculus baicalensis BBK-W-15]